MRPCFLLLITLTSFCYEAFANPWDCCGIINSPSNFSECVIHGYQNPEITGKIALAMFASNKTMIYSPYTIVVNSYYCHSKNYHFKLFTDSSTPFSYTSDKRWNKIGIVVDAFAPNGWGLNIDYLVVIDADLIVIDFSLDIGSVTSSHPDGHLFMSRDASDIANSGFFIVKNSQWSRDFFSNWWKGRLTSVTDQSAFNVLYHTLNSPKEIVLLPPDEINSEYPVYQTFNPQSRVLHLFGEIDEIRGEIFRFAAAEMCQHLFAQSGAKKRRRPNRYPPQMGITSAKLRQTAVEQILLRRSAIKSQILSCVENECPEFALVTLLESLQSETTSVCGYGRGILADQSSEKCLELSLENYDVVKALVPNNTSIAFLDHLSQNLYAAFSWSSDSIQTLQMGEEVVQIQNNMIQSGLLTALSPLLYRQSVILAELARMCDRLAQSERNISLRFRAIELARLSLKWIEATDTQPGQQDYETHIRGLVDSNMLLAELLLQSTDAEVVVMPSADMTQSRILEGFSLALNGLKWSEKLVAESERMRSNQLGSSLELLQKTCLDVSILLSAVTNKSLIEEYVQIYELSCGKYQLSSPS